MSNYTIANGCNIPINVQTGTIPDMGDALKDWFQMMTFTRVIKSIVAYREVESAVDVNFWGVIQPLSPRALMLKPEGQRAWTWFQLFAQAKPQEAVLTLDVDEVVTWLGKQTRVMARKDYALYSYVEYHLVQDWTGSGP